MTPDCNCTRPDGAHAEDCAWVRYARSAAYVPDVTLPPELVRARPTPAAPPIDNSVLD